MNLPRIADYALLSDRRGAALIAGGSIDWLCVPRFDSPSVFSRLLGDPDDSRWLLAPRSGVVEARSYRGASFILDTDWSTPTGRARSTDLMPIGDAEDRSALIRSITCTSGSIEVDFELIIRFGYGRVLPWVRRASDPAGALTLYAQAGPDSLTLHGPMPQPAGTSHRAHHVLTAGESLTWTLGWQPSYRPIPVGVDPDSEIADTMADINDWHADLDVTGPYAEAVTRSMAVLRALTLRDTGGIAAAATTSLPELIGGERNWDYRYCWLRDSALTISALVAHGHHRMAEDWRQWLLRAIAGDPDDLQIMYGVAGERELPERELTHLAGYWGSRPVRVGNGAVAQYQADVVGEVMLALARLRDAGLTEDAFSWSLQVKLLALLESRIDMPDQGLWEMRGDPQMFTQGRVMMWAAFDAGLRAMADHRLPGPKGRWRALRDRLRTEVLDVARNAGSFVQHFATGEVDAALLRIPQVGFVDYDDPLMLATVARIEDELVDRFGFVRRYRTTGIDGLPGSEGAFVMCSFWLVEQYARSGRRAEAVALMDKLLAVRSHVGLLSEEYDPATGLLLGNYPQAFSHLALIRAADALT